MLLFSLLKSRVMYSVHQITIAYAWSTKFASKTTHSRALLNLFSFLLTWKVSSKLCLVETVSAKQSEHTATLR